MFRELTYNAGREKNAAAAPSPKLLPLTSGLGYQGRHVLIGGIRTLEGNEDTGV